MSKHREPDLVQFRIEYVLDDDVSVEKFFMALNERDAIKMFAHSCQKFLSQQGVSEKATDCFVNAFANPGKLFLNEPEMLPLPEEIQKCEPPEKEAEPTGTLDTQEETVEPSPPADPFLQQEEGEKSTPFAQNTERENIFGSPSKEQKEDPAIEHARKKAENDMKIQEANQENDRRKSEYEQLSSLVLQQVDELNDRLSIIHFEEHNRWTDKWDPIPYPFKEEETEVSVSKETTLTTE